MDNVIIRGNGIELSKLTTVKYGFLNEQNIGTDKVYIKKIDGNELIKTKKAELIVEDRTYHIDILKRNIIFDKNYIVCANITNIMGSRVYSQIEIISEIPEVDIGKFRPIISYFNNKFSCGPVPLKSPDDLNEGLYYWFNCIYSTNNSIIDVIVVNAKDYTKVVTRKPVKFKSGVNKIINSINIDDKYEPVVIVYIPRDDTIIYHIKSFMIKYG